MTPYPAAARLAERLLRCTVWTANSQAIARRLGGVLGVSQERVKVL